MTEELTLLGVVVFTSVISSLITVLVLNWRKSTKPLFSVSNSIEEFDALSDRIDYLWGLLIDNNNFTEEQRIFANALPALRESEKSVFSYIKANSTVAEMNETVGIIINTGALDISNGEMNEESNPLVILRVVKKLNYVLQEATKDRWFGKYLSAFFSAKERILENINNPPSKKEMPNNGN